MKSCPYLARQSDAAKPPVFKRMRRAAGGRGSRLERGEYLQKVLRAGGGPAEDTPTVKSVNGGGDLRQQLRKLSLRRIQEISV
jgi:hypothetical protein